MLGITFLVTTSLRLFKMTESTLIDEITSVSALLFFASTVLSYLSIRSAPANGKRYEDIADYAFLLGIISLATSGALLALGVIS